MKRFLRPEIVGLFLLIGLYFAFCSVQEVKAESKFSASYQQIDACTAYKLVLEMSNYATTPDLGFGRAIEVTENGFWIAMRNTEIEMALYHAEESYKKGFGKQLSDFFYRAGRDEIIEILTLAGYVKGVRRDAGAFMTAQNHWAKKDDWKDPCPPPSAPSGQAEPVPNAPTPLPKPSSTQLILVSIFGLGLFGIGRVIFQKALATNRQK